MITGAEVREAAKKILDLVSSLDFPNERWGHDAAFDEEETIREAVKILWDLLNDADMPYSYSEELEACERE